MGLNIKNPAVEKLAAEVAALTGESKTESIRRALQERKDRLLCGVRRSQLDRWKAFLEREVWPLIPAGLEPLSRAEKESILGYGPEGV